MNSARHGHFAAALPDGSVLVVGSGGDETAAPVIASYEVYSPGTDTWTSAPLDPPRRRFCGTTLTDGRVLIAGGDDGPNGEFVSRALMYDPAAAAWSPAGDVVVPREHCTLTALPGGGALLVGGGDRAWLDSIESFDPGTATWTRVGALNEAREFHTATLVGDEAVLVAGGAGSTGRLASIERIDLATFQSTSIAEFQTARAFHTATTLNDGRVLYAGGDGGSGQGFPERAELFDPSTGRIAPGPAMVEPRRHHAAMRLSDGRILIVGGDQNRPLRSTEIFHPAAEEWRAGPELLEPRGWHQLVSLLDGRPFITGGRGATGPLLSAGFFALRAGDSDLIVGDFIGDDGTVPSQTTDPMWLSPDIRVCDTPIEDYDPAPFSTGSPPAWWPDDPESLPNTDKNYCASTAEYRDPLMSAPNYVYVRVKNEGTGNSDGDEVLKIYWAKAGTSLSWPDHWGGTIGADTESTDDYMANTCSPDGVTDFQYGSQITKPRRDASEVPAATRDAFVQAVLDIADASQFGWDQPGNNTVSFWHMQNVIHFMGSNAGWHGDRSFLPWHREFIDRFERLLQQSNPSLKLLYWDWSKPIGGLLTPTFMGSSGTPSDPFWPVSGLGLGCPSGCAVVGPEVERFTGTFSSPSNPTDVDDIVGQNDFIDYPIGPGNNCTFVPGATTGFSNLLEKGHCEFSGGSWVLAYGPHDKGHVFIGAGGGSGDPGMGNILRSPQDPIFFLHHGNVDRLWAHWQRSGGPSRISTSTAYGTGTTAMSNEDLGPWAGIGSNLRLQPDSSDTSSGAGPGGGGPEPGEDDVQPWTSDATYGGQIRAKSAADASIVLPPVYDTALLTVPELAAGQSAVLAVPWYPPDPDNYTGGGCTQQNHFCLLARLETSENTGNAFGMNSPEGSSVWNNTRDNNNVAWRNIAVSKSPTGILVGSAFSETVETQFLLTGPEDPGKRLTQIGRVFVELGGGLLERWQDAGAAGRGVRWVEGTNTIEVLEPQASLDGIMLEPGDRFPISMDYELAAGYAPPVGDEIPWLDIVQLGAPGDPTAIVGGVRIQADIRRLELVGQGGRWWYVPEGAAPDAGWTNPDYDDSSWREGEADLGFGLRPMTVIANGHSGPGGNTAYYFRRAFEFADPSIVQSLWLHLKRDDGAIVYLNGTEIHRSNMPAGSIDHGTLAEREVSGIEQETFYPISATHAIDLLRPGRNVVAVEVHQSAPESTDLVFDLALYANPVDPRVGPSIGFRTPADGSEFQLGNSIPVEVEAIDADGEVREVEVVVGEEPIAALPSAPYTFEWDDPPLGTHRLRAVAEDNDGLVSTAYQTVVVVENTKPHVSLVEPAVGASFSEGETITLVAEASDPGGAIERVEFLSIDMAGWFTDGSRLLDSVESPPYTTDVSDLPVGMHMLSAVAYDDRGATMQSDLVHVMVSANDSTRLFLPIAFSMVDVGDDGNTSPTGGGGGVSGSVYYAAQEASDDGQAIERQVYLPDFEIVLRDLDRGVDSPAIATDLFGRYRFPRQAPGRYELRWNAQSGWQAGAHPDVIEIGDGPAFPVPARVEPTPRVGTIFGSVSLGDGSSPWFSDPYFSIDHTASVTILDAARTTTLAGPIRVNSTGRFAVSGLPAGELLTVRAQSEASILTRTVPEANVSTGAPAPAVQLELGNRRPEIVSVTAYVDDEPVKTVEPGASIQLVPSTRDVDGDRLTHTWQDVTGNGVVLPADDGTATWQLPGEAGRYRAYLVVADGGGGFARQQVDFTSGMTAERFSGIAVNKSTGDGIEGATVTVGDVTASTDANGFFELAAPLADRYVLNIERVGFATLSRVVDSGLTGQTWSLVAAQSQEVDPRESFELVDERPELERARIRGTRVRIPANALVDSSGRPPTGMLNAQLATLNIAEGEAPGDWAAMLDGQEARLVSYGATYVEFRDGSGASFNLAPEMEAEVIMYPPPSMGGDVPDEAPLWSYDEADGIWRESGDATFDPSEGAYVGTVSHFSTINTDIALTDAACLRVLIYPPIKTGVKIRISDPTSSVFSQSYDFVLDAAINAAYRLPSNTTVKLELLNADGTAYGNPVVLEEQPGVPLGGNQVNTGAAIPAGQTHFPPEPYESCKLVILREPDAPSSNAFLQFKDFNNAADAAQANAYYAAIDPNDERLTLGDWWAENGFVVGTGGFPTNGTRTSYLNYNDLGSGRDMYFLQNTDGTAASYVTNYGDFDQDHSNADLAFNRTSPGATVAMEYGPVTGQGATRIVKFYVYAGGKANAQRVTSANLDGFGEKFIPNLCLNCHGGDYQPSNPAQPTFAEIDMGAAFRELDYATYRFPGGRFVPNATEKAAFKAQNEIVKGLSANDAITIQPVKDLITGWYAAGGDDQDNDWTPAGWSGTAETGLYKDVVRNSCRTCHVGLDNDPGQYGIGWISYDQFKLRRGSMEYYALCDGRQMPHAVTTYRNFWLSANPHQPAILRDFTGPGWSALGACQ